MNKQIEYLLEKTQQLKNEWNSKNKNNELWQIDYNIDENVIKSIFFDENNNFINLSNDEIIEILLDCD